MRHSDDESPPASLRGRLAEVFLPAIVGETIPPLMRRLGDLATIDEPIFGASAGPRLEDHVTKLSHWFAERSTRYSRSGIIVGIDRDIAEGVIDLRQGEKQLSIPIAVVAQRGKNRAIELRVYHATRTLGIERRGPAPAHPQDSVAIPPVAKDVIDALRTHDTYALSTALEHEGTLCDAAGCETERDAIGAVLESGNFTFEPRAVADDFRRCGIECVRPSGRASLVVVQRGDSGLIRSVRIYDED
jgi:hypothetical protein